jgi:hypothetical protein
MMMTNVTDEMVRERAYYIWEREGRPQGREAEHWHAAMEELTSEAAPVDLAVAVAQNGTVAETDPSPAVPANGAGAAVDAAPAEPRNETRKAAPRKVASAAKPSRKGRIKAIVAKAKDALDGETGAEAPPKPAEKKRKRPAKADTDAGTRSPQRS